jgi:hypothetical protein
LAKGVEREQMEDTETERRIILKQIFEQQTVKMCTGLNRLRTGSNFELL